MRSPLRGLGIRLMSDGDLSEVITIERCSQSPPWSADSFLREMRNTSGYAFVAQNDNRILGYLVFWMICDEVHLLNLAVHPDFRLRGVGEKLVAFLIDFSRRQRVRWIILDVRKSNRAATALYDNYGFQETRVRKAYYPDNHEDAIVMELELDRENS